ncbi:DUF2971 domain-containing protein [Hyphomonas sp.]|uniref:DUF2971 domain-containing protein n=1 Tax=Hyphomonas sp. TaxID=87 RepID=UPI00391D5606
MNDYDELLTGARLFSDFWAKESHLLDRFRALIHAKGVGVAAAVQHSCFAPLNEIVTETYIGCFSVHDESAEGCDLGRLSMWRGYGNVEAVALILNTERFLENDSPYNVFTYPVLYGDDRKFIFLIDEFVRHLETQLEGLRLLPDEDFVHIFKLFVEQMVLGFKHNGFVEEQEWRVVYRPLDRTSDQLERKFVSVNGQLQAIHTLPLENRIPGQEASFEIADLTHKIIIGPCPNQKYLQRLFSELLESSGMSEPGSRVLNSGIPYR